MMGSSHYHTDRTWEVFIFYVFIVSWEPCGNLKDNNALQHLHAEEGKEGHEMNQYGQGNQVERASLIHNQVQRGLSVVGPTQNDSNFITGHVQMGQAEQALDCFGYTQHKNTSSNARAYAYVPKMSGTSGSVVDQGREIYGKLVRQG